MTRVLQVGALKPSLEHTLETKYDALVLPDGPKREAFLAEHAESIRIVVTSGRHGVDTTLMEALPTLGAVVNFGVGYDTTDTTLAHERGILVSNTPDVLTDCVADVTLGLTIDLLRGISGYWSHPRAARPIAAGAALQPEDLVVKLLPLPSSPPERYIRGDFDGEHWQLEIHLNITHPRRLEHLAAAAEFKDSATAALARTALRAFYENAFHAAEHLAQAELLSYGPTVDEIADSKTHGTVKSTYQLWARLENTDPRFARLLTELGDARKSQTYLRGDRATDLEVARARAKVLGEMFEWVRRLVEEGQGPPVIHMVATDEITAGQLIGTGELALKPGRSAK